MDRYQRVEKLKVETQIDGRSRSQKQRQIDENENEIRITSQGRMCNYITYAMTLLQPYRLDERERVEAIGGWITNRYGSDCLGGLGTSRSIDLGLFFQPFLLQTCYSNALRRTRLSRARHVKTRARDGTT
ncbi:uncharacterized protein LOC130752998 isoform X7 [Actinidia eriantha]|uniref:uncharacterized protein LOC130752998 isoform X7 n=1 Tax=Actinidia eriantha TaxID=165200 RepID=UPI0025825F1E|nr:uncharacterized protein LOC130752998 isoform X7 [Actinidia eriantha]